MIYSTEELTTAEVAELLGVSTGRIRQMRLPSRMIGHTRLIERSVVDALIADRKKKAETAEAISAA